MTPDLVSGLVVHSPADLPDDELAALVAVLSTIGRPPPAAPRTRERWGEPAALLRGPLRPGSWTSTSSQA